MHDDRQNLRFEKRYRHAKSSFQNRTSSYIDYQDFKAFAKNEMALKVLYRGVALSRHKKKNKKISGKY